MGFNSAFKGLKHCVTFPPQSPKLQDIPPPSFIFVLFISRQYKRVQFAQRRMTRFFYLYIQFTDARNQRVLFEMLTTDGILNKGFGIIHVLRSRYPILGSIMLLEIPAQRPSAWKKR
jgi:hypothetical protein